MQELLQDASLESQNNINFNYLSFQPQQMT